ncbi:alpha-L-rhamnosidase [Kwoniella heveanensis BCC8398]|uniref:alpha-L-rhamnosidase n=1 Tax=Kwoniella heveanensis BCC8398 TaxID=1296120 RepID=A0A1B9GXZ7_9TREE|nr:alpha-L-rhamnosidase [Kwoniella heveanensis BCC8398]
MSVTIAALQAEHHESGFGIGHSEPRLSWRFSATDAKDWKQASYEIVVKRDGGKEENYAVDSEESVLVPWPSQALKSRDVVDIKVRSKGTDGSTTNWSELKIETGLLDRNDWKAKLISNQPNPDEKEKPKTPFRVRKTFSVSSDPARARLYATAYGIYEVEINGQRVGDQVLTPGWTSYHHHLNYQTYDVAPLLKKGENTITAYLGEGWYATRLGRPGVRNLYGERLGFLGQLELNNEVAVLSDESWQVLDGPVLRSEIYNGEEYDTTYDESKAKVSKVDILPFPKAELVSTDAPPVRRVKEVKPVEVITTPSGKKVLDFGQNLVGWVRIDKELQGKELYIRTAEVLEHGELGTRPLRTAEPNDRIILGGKVKGWEPKFTFHGFRYVEVNGVEPDLDAFTAVVIFSDLRRTGTFECSHQMINRLHENVIWGMMSNFVSVPTDCPQRDERLGWTGDIQVFAPTANYLFDTSGFLAGWLRDLHAEQKEWGGNVPVVVPWVPMRTGNENRIDPQCAWADCAIITPWDLYKAFGDRGILERQWESMTLWLDKGLPREENGLWEKYGAQYGDWLDPTAPPQYPADGRTDTHLVANAYMIFVTELASQIGELLGKKSEAARYAADAKKYKKMFQDEYITKNGRLASDSQTAFALALKFGLLEDGQIERARERLEFLIRRAYFRVSTGFAGTPILLPVLADNGLSHVAYRMLQEKECPSWLYAVSMGATTIWERWDSALPDGTINPGQMTSFNHYALGAVAQFMHNNIGGLSPLEPGWKKALIRPQPGGTITSASTSFDSPYGPYSVQWKIEGNKLNVNISVPPNATAKVVLPGVEEDVGSGKKSYSVDWKGDERWPPKGIPGPTKAQLSDEFVH